MSNLDTLKIIYNALIQSNINFGVSLYGDATKLSLDKILNLQKKGICIG